MLGDTPLQGFANMRQVIEVARRFIFVRIANRRLAAKRCNVVDAARHGMRPAGLRPPEQTFPCRQRHQHLLPAPGQAQCPTHLGGAFHVRLRQADMVLRAVEHVPAGLAQQSCYENEHDAELSPLRQAEAERTQAIGKQSVVSSVNQRVGFLDHKNHLRGVHLDMVVEAIVEHLADQKLN